MKQYLENRKERKRKRRGLVWSLLFHALLILLMLWPFIQADKKPDTDKVYVQFASASAGSSSEGAPSANESQSGGAKTEDPQPRAQPAEALPAQSMKEVPMKVDEVSQKDVLSPTAIEAPEPSVPTSRNAAPLESRETAEIKTKIEDDPLGQKEIKGLEDAMNNRNTGSAGSGDEGRDGQSDATTSGSGSGQGQTGDGQGSSGNTGSGKSGMSQSDRSGFINGDGVLTRKVIHYPNVDDIIEKEGKLAVKLCINRQGRVIYAEFDEKHSDFTSTEIAKKTVNAVTNYKFAKDPSAPERECGRLSFIVRLPD